MTDAHPADMLPGSVHKTGDCIGIDNGVDENSAGHIPWAVIISIQANFMSESRGRMLHVRHRRLSCRAKVSLRWKSGRSSQDP